MQTYLGIELGSTRIKSVLIDSHHKTQSQGSHEWENSLINGNWTYSLDEVWSGLQASYAGLALKTPPAAIGISAMMHGYLGFDKDGKLLTPFRTWRNTNTGPAAQALTEAFDFNIPHRWSIAHLYQAILNEETHVKDIAFITTLAGYVHWQLTGEKVLGVGDASGMFPLVDGEYDFQLVTKTNQLISDKVPWKLLDILPSIKTAGENAGVLTTQGAKLLDPTGALPAGIPLCPPEGDAGTGMVATNSIAERTGNISAGTSIFAMLVLEKPLSKLYPEIDMVTTPAGKPVAMVHCNNCCGDIDAWVKLVEESLTTFGATVDRNVLYTTLYGKALEGDTACGGVLTYNYFAGEPITGLDEGRPMLVRTPDADFSLANVMRSLVFSAIATLKIGMQILDNENVKTDRLLGHGGFFKTPVVGQKIMASALGTPVSVMESAGEGGAWGIAVLAAYLQNGSGKTLDAYLDEVFAAEKATTEKPCPELAAGFAEYMKGYVAGLAAQMVLV